MSMSLAKIVGSRKLSRAATLALSAFPAYNDGRTKQCHKDECDINKIMARFDKTGTISHVSKYAPVYADYSDYDFNEQMQKLTRGREVFDALPAEVRREFGQSPAAFFDFVNDPANKDDLIDKLPALAKPGTQLPTRGKVPDADAMAAQAAASEPLASDKPAPATPAEPAASNSTASPSGE